MAKREDSNQAAARIVRETTGKSTGGHPVDLRAAWEKWSAGLGKVDTRARTLLRAAFEAGWEAAKADK